MASVSALQRNLGILDWQPHPGMTMREFKSSLQRYRRDIVTPAVKKAAGVEVSPPLPWHWLATVGSCEFSVAFETWWQLRVLGHIVPARRCPWCGEIELTSIHLGFHCAKWASLCFWSGILPCEMFIYPNEEKTFIAKLRLMEELQPRMDAAQATHDDGVL